METDDYFERQNKLYESIYESIGQQSYYPIFGLKLYISASESGRHAVIEEAMELMKKNGFKIHKYEYERPKIHNGKVFSYVTNHEEF